MYLGPKNWKCISICNKNKTFLQFKNIAMITCFKIILSFVHICLIVRNQRYFAYVCVGWLFEVGSDNCLIFFFNIENFCLYMRCDVKSGLILVHLKLVGHVSGFTYLFVCLSAVVH